MLLREGHVTVMVGNMGRAITFYTETLGLTLRYQAGDKWAVVQAPGLTIGLHPAGTHVQPGNAGSLSIGFHVENLDAAMDALKQRGVEFTGVHQDEGARLAFFADPDRTPLYLAQPAVSYETPGRGAPDLTEDRDAPRCSVANGPSEGSYVLSPTRTTRPAGGEEVA